MLADSEITVESWIDRGGREEYEEGADGAAGACQVSEARPIGRLESIAGRQTNGREERSLGAVEEVVQEELYTGWDLRRSEMSH